MRLRRRSIELDDSAVEGIRPSRGRPIDLVHLALQTLGDRGLEREILGLMSRQLTQCSARLDLATPAECRALAHAVRGAARNVGAFALAEAAALVEDQPASVEARSEMMREMGRANDFIETLLG